MKGSRLDLDGIIGPAKRFSDGLTVAKPVARRGVFVYTF
jgi:hypothetical protein